MCGDADVQSGDGGQRGGGSLRNGDRDLSGERPPGGQEAPQGAAAPGRVDQHRIEGGGRGRARGNGFVDRQGADRDTAGQQRGQIAGRFERAGGQDDAAGAIGDLVRLLSVEAPTGGLVLAPGALEPAGDLPALLSGRAAVRALPVYEAVETGAAAPAAFDAVLVHSPRGGRALAGLGPFAGEIAVAISEAAAAPLAAAAGLDVRVAAHPDEAALFEALGKPAPRV